MVFSMLLRWLSPARPRVCLRHGHSGRITSALSSVNWDTRRFSCLSARYLFSALRSCSATRSSLSSQQRWLRRFVHACSHGLPMLEVALGAGVHRLKPLRGSRDSRVADGRSRRSTGRAASSAAVSADVMRSGRARARLRMVLALGVGRRNPLGRGTPATRSKGPKTEGKSVLPIRFARIRAQLQDRQ